MSFYAIIIILSRITSIFTPVCRYYNGLYAYCVILFLISNISIQRWDLSTAALCVSAQDDNLIIVSSGTYSDNLISDNLIVISTGAQRAEWRNLKQDLSTQTLHTSAQDDALKLCSHDLLY
ncbi:MAG: hypothetical protein CMQ19_11610 [Gammaproteobacteria bacterium]|nr:hypothetical protein [Gammaproteobacteria bacterium]